MEWASVSGYNFAIDEALAAALRGESTPDPELFAGPDSTAAVVKRIKYHGLSGLLHDLPGVMSGWPGAVAASVRDAALAQTIWELRHR